MVRKKYLQQMILRVVFTTLFIISSWILGLYYFIEHIPEQSAGVEMETDVIAVLTGGAMRLEEGLEAFANIKAKKILISGVGDGFTKKILLSKTNKNKYFKRIDPNNIILGSIASNTTENALETKLFMDLNHYISLRLVTSDYHMPRSLLVFKRIMPEIIIIPHPVFSNGFHKAGMYVSLPSLRIVANEYNKTIWFLLHSWVDDAEDFYDAIIMKIYSLIRPTLESKDQNQPE